jgi:hypothetical protein
VATQRVRGFGSLLQPRQHYNVVIEYTLWRARQVIRRCRVADFRDVTRVLRESCSPLTATKDLVRGILRESSSLSPGASCGAWSEGGFALWPAVTHDRSYTLAIGSTTGM